MRNSNENDIIDVAIKVVRIICTNGRNGFKTRFPATFTTENISSDFCTHDPQNDLLVLSPTEQEILPEALNMLIEEGVIISIGTETWKRAEHADKWMDHELLQFCRTLQSKKE